MALNSEDGALLEAVRSIRWPARRRVMEGLHGAHLSRVRGVSQEFTEYRAYRQGDDTRRIDWKLLARTDRAYIKLSTERTLLPTMLLVDASASLAYPVDSLEKWNYARHVAVGLAAAAHRGGDPVGLSVITGNGGDGIYRLPARTRRGVVQEIAMVLSEVKPSGTAELATPLAQLRSAGRVAIVSDFLGDTEALFKVAGQFGAAGKEVYAIHVVHRDEIDPPRESAVFVDPEQADLRRPLTEATRQQYLENFSNWCEQLARNWRLKGAYYTQVVTREPVAHAVRRIAAGQRIAGAA